MSTKLLSDIRNELIICLGENHLRYFQVIRQYFNGRIELSKFQSEIDFLFTPETIKYHHQFLKYLNGELILTDPVSTSLKDCRKRRHDSIKKKFDQRNISQRWNPPSENSIAQSALVGCWAEGLDGVSPTVNTLLENALKTYLKRVISSGIEKLKTEPRLPNIEQLANELP